MPSSSPSVSTRHRDKRVFQPSITDFFASERGSTTAAGASRTRNPHTGKTDSVVPAVAAALQANLLNVGMRVRKSVPEGYKTHKTQPPPSIQTTIQSPAVKPPREPVPDVYQHPRELLPFCGLHKIGGFAEQPTTNAHLYGTSDPNGAKPVNIFPLPAEAFNTPFSSSQLSSSSQTPSEPTSAPSRIPANPQKRSWEEDEGPSSLSTSSGFLFAYPVRVSEDDVPVSPHSVAPTFSLHDSVPQTALRPFAQPKTRRQQNGSHLMDVDGMILKEQVIDMDTENTGEMVGADDGVNDFGEADFLRPWQDGGEVKMGGM